MTNRIAAYSQEDNNQSLHIHQVIQGHDFVVAFTIQSTGNAVQTSMEKMLRQAVITPTISERVEIYRRIREVMKQAGGVPPQNYMSPKNPADSSDSEPWL